MVSTLNLKKVILSVVFIIIFYSPIFFSYAESYPLIRVAIIQDITSVTIKVKGFYEIKDPKTDRLLIRDRDLKTTALTDKKRILLGNINFNLERLLIKPDDKEAIFINGRNFRGSIELIINHYGRLLVVNHIELEDYIKGILYHEVSHYWPQEALKAQAIACRSFALYKREENKLQDFDVTCDVYSQIYGGRTSERLRTNRAVEETKGMVLTYNGRLLPAYYHATCGGKTEDASLVWNIDIFPLKGINCNFCKESPHFKWHAVLSLNEIRKKLNQAGYNIKEIVDISVLQRSSSGRINNLAILTKEEKKEILAKDLRIILGPDIIKSTNFNFKIINRDVVFEGRGWGHGVGMCQWGAYFMAKQGYSFLEILRYYYPGTDVQTIRF
ncbi:MAG: SpoIID/LytB domain-containing protein [Candidatus Omnitrophica bacterium]|nr:SpoIID/LytB domain-containing protein [Candidatus Omnitrophota bacterium]